MSLMSKITKKLLQYRDSHTADHFFKAVEDSTNKWGYFGGFEVFSPDYTPYTWRLFLAISYNFVFIAVNIYSMFIRVDKGILEVLISSITIGMCSQSLVKMYTYGRLRDEILVLSKSSYELYNELKAEKIVKTARDYAFAGWFFILHMLRYAYVFAGVVIVILPVLVSIIFKMHELPVEIELPFIDKETFTGYLINLLFQLLGVIYEVIAIQAGDAYYALLMLNAITQLQNIYFELELLDELTAKNNMKDAKVKLNYIIQLHQKYLSFFSKVNELYLLYFSVNIVTMVYQVVIALFTIATVNNKVAAPVLVFTGTAQLLIMCCIGTVFESQHDKLVRNIYNSNWYLLQVDDRKKIKLLLQMAQRDLFIEYVFGPINLPLFQDIYKKIYSGLTMLTNTQTDTTEM